MKKIVLAMAAASVVGFSASAQAASTVYWDCSKFCVST